MWHPFLKVVFGLICGNYFYEWGAGKNWWDAFERVTLQIFAIVVFMAVS